MERLDADFRYNDLYMAFGVFHLSDWSLLLQSLPASIAAETSAAAIRMRKNRRHIWDAVGCGQRTVDDWVLAVLVAIRHRDTLTVIRPQRNPSDVDPTLGPLDNRIPWYVALPEIDRCMPWFSKLCRYYFSVLDGTPTVERDLGVVQDCFAQHNGGT